MYINNNTICVNVFLNFPNVTNNKRTINQSNIHIFAIYTSWRGCEPAKDWNVGTLRKCSFVTRRNREEGNSSTNVAVQDRKNTFQLHSSIITFHLMLSSLFAHVNLWNVKCERIPCESAIMTSRILLLNRFQLFLLEDISLSYLTECTEWWQQMAQTRGIVETKLKDFFISSF